MKHPLRIVAAAATLLLTTASPSRAADETPPPPAARLTIGIAGLRNAHGVVLCALFRSADGYPNDRSKAARVTTTTPSSGATHCEFPDVPRGTYAVGVLHDENKNGKMDTNFLGIPTEGYATSRDARGTLGPPSFADARFDYLGGDVAMTVRMAY
jgi:uncharacterized protein (DUF2141 family)